MDNDFKKEEKVEENSEKDYIGLILRGYMNNPNSRPIFRNNGMRMMKSDFDRDWLKENREEEESRKEMRSSIMILAILAILPFILPFIFKTQ